MKTKNFISHRYRFLHVSLLIFSIIVMGQGCSSRHDQVLLSDKQSSIPTPGIMAGTVEDTWSPYVGICNTTNKTLEVYHYTKTSWTTSNALWIFKPTTALGFSANAVTSYEGIGDFRLHHVTGFPNKAESAVAMQGGKWLGICVYNTIPGSSYIKGQKLWEKIYASNEDPNNHAIELLPNGNIAVAGYGGKSDAGHWVRIYNTSNPNVTNDYTQTYLKQAHALLWDPLYNVLWAGGQIMINDSTYHGIFAYNVGGTRENPTLIEDVSKRSVRKWRKASNPDGLRYPHDLQPNFDDDSKMIYSDHTGVYLYDKVAKTFTRAPGPAGFYVAPNDDILMKSAGKQANGKYVITEVSSSSCTYYTPKVQFFDGDTGAFLFSRSVDNCTIYRARVFTHPYQ